MATKAEQRLNRKLTKVAKTHVPGFAAGKFNGKPFHQDQVLTVDALTLKIMLEDAYFAGQESGMSLGYMANV